MAEPVQILQSVAGQREKLDSLGTLAAGLAHELNNPAAAARRSAGDLRESLDELRTSGMRLARASAGQESMPSALEGLERTISDVLQHAAARDEQGLDELERSEREEELGLWLEDRGVSGGLGMAPSFVAAGLQASSLEPLLESVAPELRTDALLYVEAALDAASLVDEVEQSTRHISRIVTTMKGYSYMDRTPVQEVDVNGSLDDTLSVLDYRLEGVEVVRDYDPHLPRITAYGGELNQVWTSLLDNAVDAVSTSKGSGRIGLRTCCEGDRVLVEFSDDGPGIPKEYHARIFEPFFSTKDVSEGTGLGLDVSYRVIVGRHGGDIHGVSRAGETRFEVRLPVEGPVEGPDVAQTVAGRDLRMEAGA
jgi:signal transduction histidine kinase